MNPPRRGTPDFLLLLLTFVLVCFGLAHGLQRKLNDKCLSMGRPLVFYEKAINSCWLGNRWHAFLHECPLHQAKEASHSCFLFVLCWLVLVIFTSKANGASSWFNLGKFGIQPTEFAKLIVILYLASLISNKEEKFRNFKKGLLPAIGDRWISSACLIMLQPDFGSCMILLSAQPLSSLSVAPTLSIFSYWGHALLRSVLWLLPCTVLKNNASRLT